MEKHGILATPENYAVWYAYATESNLDLKKAIDAHIGANKSFSPEKNAELHATFIDAAAGGQAVRRTSDEIKTRVDDAMATIAEASDGAETYGNVLQTQVGGLTESTTVQELQKFVQTMMAATNAMVEQNQQLQTRLESSSSEIASLREDLVNVQNEALTDGLTEIANRKKFDMFMTDSVAAAVKSGAPVCLFMTDIDHFKKFNDTYGHQTGDQVLRLVASILRRNAPEGCLPARYGGEEFGVILPNTTLDAAMTVAEQVRQAVASKRMRKKQSGDDLGNITVSIGVAQYKPGESVSELIKRADDGLYFAKNAGRNQVVPETKLSNAA
jgi:diguanylate cyclase